MATPSVSNAEIPNPNNTREPPRNPRIPDDAVPYFKILRKLITTQIKSQHHSEYLKECLARRATPKGLQVKLSAQIPEPDLNFSLKWDQAHWNFSKHLTTLLADYYSARVKLTTAEIATAYKELTARCDPETLQYINKLNLNIQDKLKQELLERRNKKIADSRNTNQRMTTTRSTTSVIDNSTQPTSSS